MYRLFAALLVAMALALLGCEQEIVEAITDNTTVADQKMPPRDGNAGQPMTGNLAGRAWRVTSPADWPDTMLIIAFGSNGRYIIELVNVNPNQGWHTTGTAINGGIRFSGEWRLSAGVLTVTELVGALRRISSAVLCWDLPSETDVPIEPCSIILVRVRT